MRILSQLSVSQSGLLGWILAVGFSDEALGFFFEKYSKVLLLRSKSIQDLGTTISSLDELTRIKRLMTYAPTPPPSVLQCFPFEPKKTATKQMPSVSQLKDVSSSGISYPRLCTASNRSGPLKLCPSVFPQTL